MATIDHSDIIDLRNLATLATECGEEIADPDTDEEDVADSRDTLEKLAELCGDLGRQVDAEAVADALETLGNEYGALIDEDHFEAYARDYTEEVQEIPDWILGHIDWASVAREMQQDYTSITFDGVDYYIR